MRRRSHLVGCRTVAKARAAPHRLRKRARLKGAVVREGGGSVAHVVAEIFFAGTRASTVYRATPETIGVRKSVGAGLLANPAGQVYRATPDHMRTQTCRSRLAGERGGADPPMPRRIFFAGKSAPTLDRGNPGTTRGRITCRSRLAGEPGGSGPPIPRADIFRGQARSYS